MLTPIALGWILFSATETAAHVPPHGGILASAGEGHLELVVGPDRVALFPLDAKLEPLPLAGGEAVLLIGGQPPLELASTGDRWEAANPVGVDSGFDAVAVVRRTTAAVAARFAFQPGGASLFHDHRPFHGGLVGMAGERHMELAVQPMASGAELQLYLTDAYRQPVSPTGVTGTVRVRDGARTETLSWSDGGDCLTARIAKPSGPLDVHLELNYPDAPHNVDMDYYVEQGMAKPTGSTVTIHVGSDGFVPARIEAQGGTPVTLRFLRMTEHTCATRVVFPALGIERDLPLGHPVEISIVPRAGETAFACGMGMFRGAVVAR